MEKFCIFDQDGDALFAFDSISDFEIEFEKIAVNERKNGKCFAVVATDSDKYEYLLAVYETEETASAEIERLYRWYKAHKHLAGKFGFQFAETDLTPLGLLTILHDV